MTRCVKLPIGWPFRRALFFDTQSASVVHSVRYQHAGSLDKEPRTRKVATLYRSPNGRFFLSTKWADAETLKPLWDWRARIWLFRHPPSRDVLVDLGIHPLFLIDA